MMESSLPLGWASTVLGQVAEWGSGGTPSRKNEEYYGGTIPWIKTGELNDGIITETEEHITELGLKNSSAKMFPKGSVVIAMYGATIGRTAILGINATTNQACAVAIVNQKLTSNKFLFYYLKSQKQEFINKGKGGAQPNISQMLIKDHPVPLPPLAEQQRIVAKLDTVMEKVQSARERLEKIPAILKHFRQAVLTAAVSGRLTADWRGQNLKEESGEELFNKVAGLPDMHVYVVPADYKQNSLPSSWINCKLGQICSLITKGASPKWQGVSYASAGVLFITSENVGTGKLLLDNKKYVEPEFNNIQRRSILEVGDLLTNIVGASIGRSAIYNLKELANINQAVAILRLKQPLNNTFFLYVLNSDLGLHQMHSNKVDVARANLSLADLNNFVVPLPPLAEQAEIVRRVEELFNLANSIEARYQVAKVYLDQLPQAILTKAFRGELVHQDPSDEPAYVLLKQIQVTKKDQKTHRGESLVTKTHFQQMNLNNILNEKFGSKKFTFEEIRAASSMPYEDLRKEIYMLLNNKTSPRLISNFNSKHNTIEFTLENKQ